MNLYSMNCRQTRRVLPAYLNGELKPRARARVARHLATCDTCDAVYSAERMVSRELRSTLPLVGGGSESGRFEVMWRGIAAQLAAAPRPVISTQRWATTMVALLVGIVLALAWSPRTSVAGVPTPPTAVRIAASDAGTPVALILAVRPAFQRIGDSVEVTQTPRLQGNYAPVAGATDTP
jgi:anti-sigma factor RsiW